MSGRLFFKLRLDLSVLSPKGHQIPLKIKTGQIPGIEQGTTGLSERLLFCINCLYIFILHSYTRLYTYNLIVLSFLWEN